MSQPPEQRELDLVLPATHVSVAVARRVLRHFARMCGVADGEVEILMLVASELLANAVDHGGGGGALDRPAGAQHMRLFLRLLPRGWSFGAADEGGGDPAEVRPLLGIDQPPDLGDERGRGFFLISKMVDRLVVEKSADGRGLLFVATREHGAG